jgi:protein TonB
MAGYPGGGSWTERRGWLVALCVAAGAHAGVYQQLIQAGPAPVRPDRPPVVTVSLVATAPAPSVPAPQPVTPPPEPVTTAPPPPPEPKPRPRQVKPRPVPAPPPAAREITPAPPALPQAIASAAPPAAGVSAPVEPVLEPPRVDAAYLKNPPPAYPRTLLRRGLEGEVLVRAQVQDDGHCSQVQLKESSGYRLFDEAALSAVRDWRFIPARKGTQTVVAWVDVPISFRISHSR